MAKNTAFIIFSICLIHFTSALPHHEKADAKKIAETFEEADQLLSFIKTIPSDDYNTPALDVQSGLFGNVFSEADDELVLSCIVKYKDDYVNALNNSHNGAKSCILNARDKVIPIALEIHSIKEKISDHIENLKTVIDDCLEKNTAANVTLQCINDEIVANLQGINDGVQNLKTSLTEGWAKVKQIAKETKECLLANAEKGSADLMALVENVSNCINPNA